MTFTDPIGDMFARIRNGQMRSLNSVEIPSSNFRKNILSLTVRVLEPFGPVIVKFEPSILIEDSFGITIFFFPILDIKIPYKLFLHLYYFFLPPRHSLHPLALKV